MGKANTAIGLVAAVVVALANVSTAWAEAHELPHRQPERITRTLPDNGYPTAAAAFDTQVKLTAPRPCSELKPPTRTDKQ